MNPGLESRPGSVSASTVLHNRVGAHNGASRWTPNRALAEVSRWLDWAGARGSSRLPIWG